MQPLTNHSADAAATVQTCTQCGTQLAPSLLSCPTCQRLVHADQLKVLAQRAEQCAQAQQCTDALSTWREALELLPPDSQQYRAILAKVETLGQQVEAGGSAGAKASPDAATASGHSGWGKAVAALSVVGLLLLKFKFLPIFLLTKAKLLLVGLTKAKTVFSMLAFLGTYWTLWGWKFALGFVVTIYIHEMGHIAALQRLGIKATAPMFIPGFGAFVRLQQYPASPREDARIGLAGPLWGMGAAIASYAVFLATDWAIFAAITHVTAWINLFNLLPFWSLDGNRGFRALSRSQRWIAVAVLAAAWAVSKEGLLILLLIMASVRAFAADAAAIPDRRALLQYAGLIIILAGLCIVHVPVPTSVVSITH